MKKKMITIILTLLCGGITACGSVANNGTQTVSKSSDSTQNDSSKVLSSSKIKPEEAKKRLESEKGIILLDVRTQEEYIEKHIPESMLIPVEEIEKEARTKLTDKNSIIFVYCRSGKRSAIAVEALVKMGYTRIFDLGGIINWPYETESGK